jgi:hypothetical protein
LSSDALLRRVATIEFRQVVYGLQRLAVRVTRPVGTADPSVNRPYGTKFVCRMYMQAVNDLPKFNCPYGTPQRYSDIW